LALGLIFSKNLDSFIYEWKADKDLLEILAKGEDDIHVDHYTCL